MDDASSRRDTGVWRALDEPEMSVLPADLLGCAADLALLLGVITPSSAVLADAG